MFVFEEFEKLCAIPHPSGCLDEIRAYIIKCAQACGVEVETDAVGNVKVTMPATAGRESEPGVILQAHMDMVPQTDATTQHNWQHDGLKLQRVAVGQSDEYPDSELIMATGTTLGADNGVGVAAMLAIMKHPEISHAPLELLFTVDEETGMTGVRGMEAGWLKGKYLYNLDTEEEGTLMVSCAGAVNLTAKLRYKMDENLPEGDVAVRLSITGLKGGHSGMDIHLGRGNAVKLMTRFLKHVVVGYEARLASFVGGTLRNAIAREAEALITVPAEVADELMQEVEYYNELFKYELRGVDEGVSLTAQAVEMPAALIPEEIQDDLLNCIEAAHDGVLRMSPDLPSVVETSSNLASVYTSSEGVANVVMLVRSLNDEMKRALASRLQSCFVLGGMKVDFTAPYSGWELPLGAPLVERCKRKYASLFGTELKVSSVHCGLECGILSSLYPELEIVSFGPTIHHPHSPQESVEVESIKKFWKFLVEML
ncbi:MAG: aminoacyl-histidine dipeptidase [Bacteroidales bacterium]|nr:aminoacyl-histidine dipeptidase [Bacteroidales bacterium]